MTRSTTAPRNLRAFTLIELLTTIVLLMIIIGILMPAMGRTKMMARVAVCQAHMRQFTLGWVAYPIHNKKFLVYGRPDNSRGWVKNGSGYGPIEQGTLYPFVNNVEVYQCPEDPNGNERSFSIVGPMYGEAWNATGGWKHNGTHMYARISNPAKQMVFMEESDHRGYNLGSFVMYCGRDRWYNWIDYVSIWHGSQSNISFADGHIESWQWFDDRTVANAISRKFYQKHPGSEDWLRVRTAYRQLPEAYPDVPLLK